MTNANEKAMWSCMVGEVDRSVLPSGSDEPMREAVAAAYRKLTGRDDVFIFSGWGDQLDEAHRAVVENREPDHYKIRDDLAEHLGQCEQFIAHLGSDVAALPEPTDPDCVDAAADFVLARLREQHIFSEVDRDSDDPRSITAILSPAYGEQMVHIRVSGVPIPNPESGDIDPTSER